jgi:hypothetical protein
VSEQVAIDFSPRRVLDFSEPKAPKKGGGWTVRPEVVSALRRVLVARHVGRECAATWEHLLGEVRAEGVKVGNVRRLQQAAKILRRVEKLAVGGNSQDGIYIIVDDKDRRFTVGERLKRVRDEFIEIEALDRALYERLAPLLFAVDAERDAL